ncbi:MAG: MMPL family transporter [Myxococcales bacterium]|nr:MMPL family transporter [Myxococcales bacterium]
MLVNWGTLAAWVLDHPRLVTTLLVVSVIVSVAVGFPPRIEPNLLALLPPDDRASQDLAALHEAEGGANLVTLSFDGPEEDVDRLLDGLAETLAASDRVQWALHTVDEELATQIGLLQLEPSDLEQLTARLQGALALGPALNPMMTQRLMAMGPVTERIDAAIQQDPTLGTGGGRLLVRPTGSSHDPAFSLALITEVEQAVEHALAEAPGVELSWIGGAYRHNVEDYRGIRQDLAWTSGASLLMVLAVLAFAFRSAKAVVLVCVPLVISVILTLGLARLLVGSLNTYTSLGGAVLVGLGIDFAVHLVGRFRELRTDGLSPRIAIVVAWERVGPPCVTAALTSAAGFAALAIADFRGFSQLGVLLATGLLVTLLVMFVTLPLLILGLDARAPLLRGVGVGSIRSRSSYAWTPLLLTVLVLATAGLGSWRLPQLTWEYDVSALRRDGLAYAELDAEARALARESYAPVVVSFDDAATRDEVQASVRAQIGEGTLPHVARTLSIADVLPPDQPRRLEVLERLKGLLADPNLRYLPPPLVEPLLPLRAVALQPLTRDSLPPPLLAMLGAATADQHRMLMIPQGNMWDLRQAADLHREVHRAVPEHPAAGEHVALGSLFGVIQRDMPVVALFAFLLVVLITAVDLRRPVWVLGAVGTVLAGMVWAGLALEAASVRLTMINIVGIPILLGIGVDVVIHLLHRLAEEGPGGVRRALGTTGVAAAISAVTTILSFLSLTLAGNRGVRSLGMLVVIGLIAVVVASVVLLPTAWAAGWRLTGRAPSAAVNA